MTVCVEPVARDRSGLLRFWKAGLGPYEGDPHFVTPLFADMKSRWSPKAALFEHAETVHFVAVREGRDVGRVAATIDREQDRVYGDTTGLFGWFECEQSPATAHALLDSAADWLGKRGRNRVRGPLSYTTNGISGLLVEDHEPGPAVIDMAYNPPWYAGFLEGWGLEGAKDLLAFWAPATRGADSRLSRIADRLARRSKLTIREVRTSKAGFREDVDHVLRIYNEAWERNWGFVPLSEAEIREQARSFRPILDPRFMVFAEHEGEPVAFGLALPDVNQALGKIRGRLWPWSVVRLALAMRRIDRTRTITLGVLPAWRNRGLDALVVSTMFGTAVRLGHTGGECSWVLADNRAMITAIERIGGRPYRRYRIYEKDL